MPVKRYVASQDHHETGKTTSLGYRWRTGKKQKRAWKSMMGLSSFVVNVSEEYRRENSEERRKENRAYSSAAERQTHNLLVLGSNPSGPRKVDQNGEKE